MTNPNKCQFCHKEEYAYTLPDGKRIGERCWVKRCEEGYNTPKEPRQTKEDDANKQNPQH